MQFTYDDKNAVETLDGAGLEQAIRQHTGENLLIYAEKKLQILLRVGHKDVKAERKEERTLPAFGGIADEWHILSPSNSPPEVGYRLITGQVWEKYIYKMWRVYLALRTKGLKFHPPRLAGPAYEGFFFTDQESLEGIMLPEQFAFRFGLSLRAQQECQLYGCAIIKFHLPEQGAVVVPDPYPGQSPGLSRGGAREWKTTFNLPLDSSMVVTYIDRDQNGVVRCYNITL